MRERFVYAPAAGVWINGVPDCLSGLTELRQEVPVIPDALMGGYGCPMQPDVVLPMPPRPYGNGPLPAAFEVAPERPLVRPRQPVVGKLYSHFVFAAIHASQHV